MRFRSPPPRAPRSRLEALGDAIEAGLETFYRVDTTAFGDPLADEVRWNPMVGGGRNFRTHHLVARPPSRWEFRPSIGISLVAGLLVLCGVGFITLVHAVDVDPPAPGEPDAQLVGWLLGGMFVVAGLSSGYLGTRPIVFDAAHGAYWRGRLRPGARPDASTVRDYTPLADIHALQIIAEWDDGVVGWYRSYELNLVLHDGRRVHVVDHEDGEHLRKDAAELAHMLSVPVWDATLRPRSR